MLRLSATITNLPIMSLRTGGKVAVATEPIINPSNLKIEGWYCSDVFNHESLVLLSQDVREFVPQGIAINDYADLAAPEELVRLEKVLELEFKLLGKAVVTNHKRRLGKVSDYALETESMRIQKLYVARPMYRSITDGQLSIDRSQIIEITNTKVIVREADVRARENVPATMPATS
jgi:sporulation protein YlmC with PRC-barrel domain